MKTPRIQLLVYTRDAHPADHCSFAEQGGRWPVHCVKDSPGYALRREILAPAGAIEILYVDKGTRREQDTYSGFDDTGLAEHLRRRGIQRLLIAGLATDYCVLQTALDGSGAGFDVWVLTDALAAVEARKGDGQRAILEMRHRGVRLSDTGQIVTILDSHPLPTALVLVDLQHDFFPGGALAVAAANQIVPPLQRLFAELGLRPV